MTTKPTHWPAETMGHLNPACARRGGRGGLQPVDVGHDEGPRRDCRRGREGEAEVKRDEAETVCDRARALLDVLRELETPCYQGAGEQTCKAHDEPWPCTRRDVAKHMNALAAALEVAGR